jgi:hypothetical protein
VIDHAAIVPEQIAETTPTDKPKREKKYKARDEKKANLVYKPKVKDGEEATASGPTEAQEVFVVEEVVKAAPEVSQSTKVSEPVTVVGEVKSAAEPEKPKQKKERKQREPKEKKVEVVAEAAK